MADISATIQKLPNSSNLVGGFSRVETFVWEPAADGTSSAAQHELIAIPAGEVLIFAVGYVITSFASGTSHQFSVSPNDDNVTGAILEAALAAGDVITIGLGADTVVTSSRRYGVAAATLDVTNVGVSTAGKMYIKCFFDDVAAYQTQMNS